MNEASPIWLVPQLLSLDTAAVAVAWQLLFARTVSAPLPWPTLLVTACTVWMIYVADHLLDTRKVKPLSIRHRFVRQHKGVFSAAFAVLLLTCCACLFWLPRHTLVAGTYLTLAVLIYAAVVHFASGSAQRWWPKEIVIGVVFALGATIGTWSNTHLGIAETCGLLLFVGVCVLNCAMLEYEEWQRREGQPFPPHISTRWIGHHSGLLTSAVLVGGVSLIGLSHNHVIGLAVFVSAALQFFFLRIGRHWSADSVRALADASLLVPVLLLICC